MIRKPCRICGSTDIPKYFDKKRGVYKTECRKCSIENSCINQDIKRRNNIEEERRKVREWTREWRKNNPEKVKKHNMNKRIKRLNK